MADSAPFALTNLSDAKPEKGRFVLADGGDVRINIKGFNLIASQFSMSYGLNSIPTATALIALGRDARTGERSAAHAAVAELKQMAPVFVSLTGSLLDWDPSRKQWPPSPVGHIIFVGYVSGVAYRRSLGRVSLVLNMVHKLVDLSMSAAGSADVVPGAINDIMLPASYEGAGGKIASTAGGKFIGTLSDDISVDFSEGLLKVIEYLCKENQLQIHEAWCGGDQGVAATKRDNSMALGVLRQSLFWKGIRNLIGTDEYCAKYPLQITANGKPFVANWVGRRVAASLAGDSLWGLLIGSLLPSFGLYLIPTAQEAYLAPIIPMSRTVGKTIKPQEYVDFNLKMMSQRPLYGVGIFASYNVATIEKTGDSKFCVGATYTARSPEGSTNDGMWLFTQAPGWMDGWVNYDPKVLDGNPDVVAMMNEPSHDAAGVDVEAFDRSASSEVDGWNNVMENYARMVYASNSLRGRSGSLVGKLRFDIAPGTTLRVEAKGDATEDSTESPDDLAATMVGLVASVTVTINAEQASATTSFELTNLRTDEENGDDRMSMGAHPFFPSHFNYAPLVKALKID